MESTIETSGKAFVVHIQNEFSCKTARDSSTVPKEGVSCATDANRRKSVFYKRKRFFRVIETSDDESPPRKVKKVFCASKDESADHKEKILCTTEARSEKTEAHKEKEVSCVTQARNDESAVHKEKILCTTEARSVKSEAHKEKEASCVTQASNDESAVHKEKILCTTKARGIKSEAHKEKKVSGVTEADNDESAVHKEKIMSTEEASNVECEVYKDKKVSGTTEASNDESGVHNERISSTKEGGNVKSEFHKKEVFDSLKASNDGVQKKKKIFTKEASNVHKEKKVSCVTVGSKDESAVNKEEILCTAEARNVKSEANKEKEVCCITEASHDESAVYKEIISTKGASNVESEVHREKKVSCTIEESNEESAVHKERIFSTKEASNVESEVHREKEVSCKIEVSNDESAVYKEKTEISIKESTLQKDKQVSCPIETSCEETVGFSKKEDSCNNNESAVDEKKEIFSTTETSGDESTVHKDKEVSYTTDTSSDESVHKKNRFFCTYKGCNAGFPKTRKLTNHLRIHTGERPFVCDLEGCSKTYTNSSHLRRHKKLYHEKQKKKIPCTVRGCTKEFCDETSLKRHCKRTHNPDRQYRFNCAECKQGFHKKNLLQNHLYLHTGVLNFSCNICKIKFVSEYQFNKHKRNHRIYKCECGEDFGKWTHILAHKKKCRKPEFKCDICEKTFSQKNRLNRHRALHDMDGETSIFVCPRENCGRRYLHKRNLTYHLKVAHEGVRKKIPCPIKNCTATLSKMQNLKTHLKVHKEGPKHTLIRKLRKDAGSYRKSSAFELAGLGLVSSAENNAPLPEVELSNQDIRSC